MRLYAQMTLNAGDGIDDDIRGSSHSRSPGIAYLFVFAAAVQGIHPTDGPRWF
jgi:hypothetical protein